MIKTLIFAVGVASLVLTLFLEVRGEQYDAFLHNDGSQRYYCDKETGYFKLRYFSEKDNPYKPFVPSYSFWKCS